MVLQGGNIRQCLGRFHHALDIVVQLLDVCILGRIGPHFQTHRTATLRRHVKGKAGVAEMHHGHEHFDGMIARAKDLAVAHGQFVLVRTHNENGLGALVGIVAIVLGDVGRRGRGGGKERQGGRIVVALGVLLGAQNVEPTEPSHGRQSVFLLLLGCMESGDWRKWRPTQGDNRMRIL